MKTKSLSHTLIRGIKESSVAVAAALILFVIVPPTRAASAAELLEKGIYTEETKGDLNAASRIYQEIVDDPNADRSLVAQAQLRLGLCELKLGNKPQAISALERLTREFPDKDKLLTILDTQMPKLLDEMLQQIEQNYIQDVDRSDLLETAIRAIVGKLDSRAGSLRTNDLAFLSTNEVTQLNEGLGQKIGGIGAVLKFDESAREVAVTTPLPDSPALKAGLLSDDRIIKVDGGELPSGKELATAMKLLRGPAGTPVTLSVKRPGATALLEIELVRDMVRVPSVLGDHYKPDGGWDFMLDDVKKIGYVRLTQLGNQSPAEMLAALNNLHGRGMKALILDLRNNPGGSLADAIAVADLFVESGKIVTVRSRTGDQVYEASLEGTFSDFPMALLVNRRTASAAEIIASCLQDNQRAVVVGERTFGRGIVLNLINLKSGTGALKLPVAAWYRPNGKPMNRFSDSKDSDDWGVEPDHGFEVRMTDDELKQYEKYRSERDKMNNPSKIEFEDLQLRKALENVIAQLEKK